MGKRKHRPILHQQEQCDVWLSTAEKKEQTPAAKRQRLFRPITNISNLILSSQPIKPGTKQTDIKNFFVPKSVPDKENAVPQASLLSSIRHLTSPEGHSSLSNKARTNASVTELVGHRTLENTASFKTRQDYEAKSMGAISISNPPNNSFSEPHSIPPDFKAGKDKTNLLHDASAADFSSPQDLNTNEPFHMSQNLPRISTESEESGDINFTMGSEGCLKVKRSKTKQDVEWDTFDTQESLKAVACDSELYAKREDIPDSQYSQITSHACHGSSENEASDNINFTMGTQGCLRMKTSEANRRISHNKIDEQKCLNAVADDCDLSTKRGYILDYSDSQSILDVMNVTKAFETRKNESSENEAVEDITFTMGTQGCLKVKQSKTKRNVEMQENLKIDAVDPELSAAPDDIDDSPLLLCGDSILGMNFTMGSQGCLKVRHPKGERSNITPSEDSSQDVAFTVGTQGCLKLKGYTGSSNIIPSQPSENLSQDLAFTMGSQGCLKVRGERSNITPSPPLEDSSQDELLTMGSQGCLKVRDPKGERSNITPSPPVEDSSQDVAFTMGSQGCPKVKGYSSNITTSQPSENLTQDVALTMGSQGCLKVKGYSSNIMPSQPSENLSLLSQDTGIAFTMGSQGCLKVKGHSSTITPLSSQSEFIGLPSGAITKKDKSSYSKALMFRKENYKDSKLHHYTNSAEIKRENPMDSDTQYKEDNDFFSDDDEFSQTQDW